MEVSHCELCKKPYNVKLLGNTDVPTDNLLKVHLQHALYGIITLCIFEPKNCYVLRLNAHLVY